MEGKLGFLTSRTFPLQKHLASTGLLYILSIISVLGTFLPLSKSKIWWVRAQAYSKQWYFFVHLMMFASYIFSADVWNAFGLFLWIHMIGALYCLKDIIPFTQFYPKEVGSCNSMDGSNTLGVFIYNVYQKNKNYQALIDLIRRYDPELILLLETDLSWEEALEVLTDIYPYTIQSIRQDTYGIMLLSKVAPLEGGVEHLTNIRVPSIDLLIEWQGKKIRIMGLHPLPPVPGEALTSKQKDAEFEAAATYLNALPKSQHKVVIGDLNDVVWSKTSKKFKTKTGLKDPRIGRGTYGTFPTYFPLRFPLDQIYCSSEFKICKMERLPDIGSDHYPMYIALHFQDA